MAPRFSRSSVINVGVEESVTFSTGLSISLQKKFPRMVRRSFHSLKADASFAAGENFGGERGVRIRDDIAHAEIAIQLVQSWRAKRAVNGSAGGDSVFERVHQRNARTERRL